MKECPACAGPAEVRKTCATCKGNMEVTQEVIDQFMLEKNKQEDAHIFWGKVQEYMYQVGNFKFEANEKIFELKK
jgi:hypothetical protein